MFANMLDLPKSRLALPAILLTNKDYLATQASTFTSDGHNRWRTDYQAMIDERGIFYGVLIDPAESASPGKLLSHVILDGWKAMEGRCLYKIAAIQVSLLW
jgi:hypothetical protein